MASKLVLDRQRSSERVAAVANTQAGIIADALTVALKPHLAKGEKLPDFALLAALFGRRLEVLTTTMVAADAAHETELADDAAPREARDAGVAALYEHLVDLRTTVTGVYGAKAAEDLRLTGKTPRDPLLLSRFAEAVEGACKTAKLPKPKVKGATLHLADLAAEVAALRAPLDQARSDVAREAREATVTLNQKTSAVAAYDDAFEAIATVLEGLLLAAGQSDLAAKVKPSARKPGETGDDPGDGSPPGATPPPAPPPTGAPGGTTPPTS
jgi:hypothetical protein